MSAESAPVPEQGITTEAMLAAHRTLRNAEAKGQRDHTLETLQASANLVRGEVQTLHAEAEAGVVTHTPEGATVIDLNEVERARDERQ